MRLPWQKEQPTALPQPELKKNPLTVEETVEKLLAKYTDENGNISFHQIEALWLRLQNKGFGSVLSGLARELRVFT